MNQYGIRSTNPYVVDRFVGENGKLIDKVIVPGSPRPPAGFLRVRTAGLSVSETAVGDTILTKAPALNWVFGCSPTSAAMMFGYYDNCGYPNMYTGPANGGVFPMTGENFWGTDVINGETRHLCPLSATRSGLDGRPVRGHVDDYWVKFGDPGPDPFEIYGWPEHAHGECTGDYMGTNQSRFDQPDGSTTFGFYHDGSPLYDYTGDEPESRDGCHGMKLFVESRGYQVQSNGNFNQLIYGYEGNTQGFTYDNFKAEINAGRPVLIHLKGHTMLGYGYNDDGSVIFVHNTWDEEDHSMTWGGTYGAGEDSMEHIGVTVLSLAAAYTPLYFPHVDTKYPWRTEIALINTSSDQTVTGTMSGFSNAGRSVETMDITLSPHGRRQIIVAEEFVNDTDIGYMVFDTESDTVQGYTKFYQEGVYRAAIPAVREINTSDIYISHIDSSADWWTGISLVNTTSAEKDVIITFSDGRSVTRTLAANGHDAFTIAKLFGGPQPDIKSAVITNANGIMGLELFGHDQGDKSHLDGLLVTDDTALTIYYPHIDCNGWWTGIVAYNPSAAGCDIIINPYKADGSALSASTHTINGKETYVDTVTNLGLPAQTAWFRIDSELPLSGFELFCTSDEKQLAAYAGGGGTGAKAGVFAKIEEDGWTDIAFVNTEAGAASITLTAYKDDGSVVATQKLRVSGHAKEVNMAENLFSQDISGATYIAYSSDRNVVGFQLNGFSDDTMLDGLPALVVTNGL